jgi:hypothetical protein
MDSVAGNLRQQVLKWSRSEPISTGISRVSQPVYPRVFARSRKHVGDAIAERLIDVDKDDRPG